MCVNMELTGGLSLSLYKSLLFLPNWKWNLLEDYKKRKSKRLRKGETAGALEGGNWAFELID